MQSTGQTSTQAVSLVPMHGSVMTNGMWSPRWPGGFAPPDPPAHSLAGTPPPRAAREARSLRSLAMVYELTPGGTRGAILRPMKPRLLAIVAAVLALSLGLPAQCRVTTPKDFFGFEIGDDYQLANYQQIAKYWRTLDSESDRPPVEEIGQTAEGRPQLMALVTSPENHRNLAKYKDISRRLALAEGLTDDQARDLAREGKAV